MNDEERESASPQRFGEVVEDHQYGGGQGGLMRAYVIRDSESGARYGFMYADIVTDGYRTCRVGERVRFLVDPNDQERARYVIRLDQPDPEAYYR
ncbi:hypothetical protein [Streptomyces sp. NPDC000931]|uniref:hypothetical protein n=1 Tax=Streptomyces sp. NPDC000931 TaxID=3154372 RepID=UPI00332DC2C4